LVQLDATILARQEELSALGRNRTELETAIAGLQEDQSEQIRQRQFCLDELTTVRGHLAEARTRLLALRDLVEERENDLSSLRETALAVHQQHEADLTARQAGLAQLDTQIQESCETLAGLTEEVEATRRTLGELREQSSAETQRLSSTSQELAAHLARKQSELGALGDALEQAREALQAVSQEREQRLQEAQSRLSQVLLKRKVAEDDLAAKMEQLEQANAALAEAGTRQFALQQTLSEQAKAACSLALLQERLRVGAEDEQALNARLASLQERAAQLEQLETQCAERQQILDGLEQQVATLEQRAGLLAPAATLEEGTLRVLAVELIQEIDSLDEQILRLRRFACDDEFAAELERLRHALLDILARQGVFRFAIADGEFLRAEDEVRCECVGTKAQPFRAGAKVIETVRAGYVHRSSPAAADFVLRRAGVVTARS
jgi:chromosome segregation ATPase